jgi:ATP-dependent RNA helicase DDX21
MSSEPLLSPKVLDILGKKGITQFTDIQRQTFVPVFEGRDMIARSRTGTGKTMAFGLPMVERMGHDVAEGGMVLGRGRGPRMLVMAPTRELARQVKDELDNVGRAHRLSTTVFHGGAAYGPQEGALRNGACK